MIIFLSFGPCVAKIKEVPKKLVIEKHIELINELWIATCLRIFVCLFELMCEENSKASYSSSDSSEVFHLASSLIYRLYGKEFTNRGLCLLSCSKPQVSQTTGDSTLGTGLQRLKSHLAYSKSLKKMYKIQRRITGGLQETKLLSVLSTSESLK